MNVDIESSANYTHLHGRTIPNTWKRSCGTAARRSTQARPWRDFNTLNCQAGVVSGDRGQRDHPAALLRDRLH